MKERDGVVRKRVDAVDETILMALKEGQQSLGNLSTLSGLNYHTCRQRLNKLIRYNFLAKPGYGEYALSEEGRRFVEELTLPVAPDLKDPKLKKLIDMLPTELHRAFFRLLLSGITAKYHLADAYDDGYPAFILGGETKSFKTALANVVCRLLGLKPEDSVYALFSAIAGEFGIRRFRTKGNDHYSIAASPLFKQPFICLDEFDKVTDKDTRRNILFYLDGRYNFTVEGELVENRVCTMVTLNTRIGKEGIQRFGIPDPYIRRSIVADTEHVRMELRDVDLVAKRIFEMKDFSKINLNRLRLVHTELPNDVFSCLRNLLMNYTNEAFQGLIDTRPLVILSLGRSALLDGDVRAAMYQTLWDRLICLESLGGTLAGWREKVGKEWGRHRREEQPEIEKQLKEVEEREKERRQIIAERKASLEGKKVEQIDDETAFILHRAELSFQIQKFIHTLGCGEPLIEPLRWLRGKVNASRTAEQLGKYEESFNKSMLPKVQLRLQEKSDAEEQVKRDKASAKAIAAAEKESKQRAARLQKEQDQEGRRQNKTKIMELGAFLKQINYYLRRKDLREGEDPVLVLQQLRVIRPVEGPFIPSLFKEPVKGYWLMDRLSGKPKYNPPIHDFTDYGCKISRLLKMVVDSKIYDGSGEVRFWTSWTNVWPLLQAKRTQILSEITMLAANRNMEKG
ncbi:hypothetical protein ACFLRP_03265 [Bacteroidota bacterium]